MCTLYLVFSSVGFSLVYSVVVSLAILSFCRYLFIHSCVCCAGATAAHSRFAWTRETGATAATTNHPHDARTAPTTSTASARQHPSSHDASRTDDTNWWRRRRSDAANADDWRSSFWDDATVSGGGGRRRRDGRRFYDRSAAYDVMAGTATPSTGTGTVPVLLDIYFILLVRSRVADQHADPDPTFHFNAEWSDFWLSCGSGSGSSSLMRNPWLFKPPRLHFDPLNLLSYDINADSDPDPYFRFNADPYQTFHAFPDQDHHHWCESVTFLSLHGSIFSL